MKDYLRPYVRFLPVPVAVNGELISQASFEATLGEKASRFVQHATRQIEKDGLAGRLETLLNSQARLSPG